MKLSFVPLLEVQRDLYARPRGLVRFREYLRTMVDAATGDLALPLVAMNPMGLDHVPALIGAYLGLDAEGIAAAAVAEAARIVEPDSPNPTRYRVGLVVSDDLKGGWTNRYASDFTHRFESAPLTRRGWLVGLLWTSEPASAAAVREAVLMSIYRALHLQTHPIPTTLGEMLAQEGYVSARAGCTGPSLEEDELEYTRVVLAPHLQATDRGTVLASLYGDAAASALGYPPLGLSDRAGLALALHDARVPRRSSGDAFR